MFFINIVKGELGGFEYTSECSKSCGGGYRTKRRVCGPPKGYTGPAKCYTDCTGNDEVRESCNTHDCIPDSKYYCGIKNIFFLFSMEKY